MVDEDGASECDVEELRGQEWGCSEFLEGNTEWQNVGAQKNGHEVGEE